MTKPADDVISHAAELWRNHVRQEGALAPEAEVTLPTYEAQPEAWEPWIQKVSDKIASGCGA